MSLEENEEIITLRSQQDTTFHDYPYKPIVTGNYTFNKFYANVITSPYFDKFQDGICIKDIKFDFWTGKYGCYIIITDKNQDPISIRLLLI